MKAARYVEAPQAEMTALVAAAETLMHWPLSRVRAALDALGAKLVAHRAWLAPELEALRFTHPGSPALLARLLAEPRDPEHRPVTGVLRTQLRQFRTLAALAAALESRFPPPPPKQPRSRRDPSPTKPTQATLI